MFVTLGYIEETPRSGMRERVARYASASYEDFVIGANRLPSMVGVRSRSGAHVIIDPEDADHMKLLHSIGRMRFGSAAYKYGTNSLGHVEFIGKIEDIRPGEKNRSNAIVEITKAQANDVFQLLKDMIAGNATNYPQFICLREDIQQLKFLLRQLLSYEFGTLEMAIILHCNCTDPAVIREWEQLFF